MTEVEKKLRRLGDGAYNLIMGMCVVSSGGAIRLLADKGDVVLTVGVTVFGGVVLILMISNIAKRAVLVEKE